MHPNWAAIGIVCAAEVAVFFAATVRTFTARARLNRERDGDIRTAIAGFESGAVIPALARLVTEVDVVRRPDEPIEDALNRADIGGVFGAAVAASILSQSPRLRESALVRRYVALGFALLAAQIAGPIALYNALTPGYNLPHTAVIVAAVVFVIGVIGASALAVLVARGEIALANAITAGRDAA